MGEGPRGNNGACFTLLPISIFHSDTHNQTGPLWCWFPSGWACACSRPLWVSPMNSPVRLGVALAEASTPTGVFTQRFEALFPCPGTLGCSIYLATHLFLPVYLYANVGPPAPPASNSPGSPADALLQVLSSWLPISAPLQVWMNVSSLTPWLSDFHTVRFSVRCGCFLFLNYCCPSFGCGRRHSVSTYASILAGSPTVEGILVPFFHLSEESGGNKFSLSQMF